MLGETPNRILEEYCELTGLQQSAVISVLLLEDLWKRLARARHLFQMNSNNVYSPTSDKQPENTAKKKPTSRKKKKTPMPKDFDPPKEICEEAGVDHDKAVRFFKAQVEAKGYTYVDWNKAFALAVNGYLVQNYPQILQTKQENEF